MSKVRLTTLLVSRGLAQDKAEAKRLIGEAKVSVAGIVNDKVGAQVDSGVHVKLRSSERAWVSRGAHKLLAGLRAFNLDPRGLVAMDVGASTGGFTDVLLERGARKVFAVDVGYGQLAWKLRQDSRVVVLERENIRTLKPEKLGDPIDMTVIDASFISLTLILGKIAVLMGGSGGKPIIALIKPQFEARKEHVGEGGVVRDDEVRQACVDKVLRWAAQRGFGIGGLEQSPLRGPAGNIEFLVELRTPPSAPPSVPRDEPVGCFEAEGDS